MRYEPKDGSEHEIVWNSRDGVTPFGIMLRSGVEALHVRWSEDWCEPGYVPELGERIFVDLNRERGAQLASEFVDKNWDDPDMPMRDHPYFEGDKKIAVRKMYESYFEHGTPPDLIEVNETLRDRIIAENARWLS